MSLQAIPACTGMERPRSAVSEQVYSPIGSNKWNTGSCTFNCRDYDATGMTTKQFETSVPSEGGGVSASPPGDQLGVRIRR